MRTPLLLLALAASPLLGLAQNLTATSYELADGSKGTGQLMVQPGYHTKLLVADAAAEPGSKAARKGKEIDADKVRCFDVGSDHYVLVRSMKLGTGMPMTMGMTKKDEFAKVLETGKLDLLQYDVAYMTSTRGMPGLGTGRDYRGHTQTVYILRRAGEDDALMIPTNPKKIQEMIAPYFAGRPDLQKRLTPPPTSEAEYRALVQAYNASK